ncbi:MAG: hypothetical protein KAT71_08240 [Gammaproteobacteria bacterium]|nr:hypothetical protein [Gammaproteobacteria bacterium]
MRRLISLEIVDTDAFLDMPATTQLLYFHLNTRADDDGFIASPRKVMRMLGVAQDDLKVLIGKKFIISFEDGVCVIKHWRINNSIRLDRYNETVYIEHKKSLRIRQNGAYTSTDDERALPVPAGFFTTKKLFSNGLLDTGCQVVAKRLAQGKVSKVKLSKDKIINTAKMHLPKFDDFWANYPNKKAKAKARTKYIALITKKPELHEIIINALSKHKETKQWNEANGKYIPHPTTWLNQERWEDEIEEGDITNGEVLKY